MAKKRKRKIDPKRDAAYRRALEANPGTNRGGGSTAGTGSAQARRRAKNRGRAS